MLPMLQHPEVARCFVVLGELELEKGTHPIASASMRVRFFNTASNKSQYPAGLYEQAESTLTSAAGLVKPLLPDTLSHAHLSVDYMVKLAALTYADAVGAIGDARYGLKLYNKALDAYVNVHGATASLLGLACVNAQFFVSFLQILACGCHCKHVSRFVKC